MGKTYIIAEAGSNHNGNYLEATRLIDEAVKAGCDAIKFQLFKTDNLYIKDTPNFANYNNINSLLEDLEMPDFWLTDLQDYCEVKGIDFFVSPFDDKMIDRCEELNMKFIKIAGFESTDMRFVRYAASKKIPLIVSIGIGHNESSILELINIVREEMEDRYNLKLLHCNHSYPTPYFDVNLDTIYYFKELIKYEFDDKLIRTNTKIGFSDHTEGIFVPSIAVAKGAEIIEKHFTRDKKQIGPDHEFSLNPKELKQMVEEIRIVEQLGGIRNREVTGSEQIFQPAMRSVVTLEDMKVGDILTRKNITTKRPKLDNSIPASKFQDILDKKVNKDINKDNVVTWGDLDG